MLISDVTQSKASPKYEKCTFADTGRLNSTLDIPGFLPRKRLAVQKFHVMWKHHGLFGAFSSFHICFAIWLIRGFRRYGWKLFAAYPDLFSRCFHLGMDLWKSYCTCWICCSVSTEKLFTTLYPVTYPLKCHPKGFFTKDPVYIYIYIDILHILYFFHLFTDIRILIYIYIYAYIESDLGGQTVGPLLTVASSLEGWFVSYTLSHEVSSKVVWKNQPKEFFYDLLVDKEILPAETLAQMQETFFRVKKSCIFDGQLRCFCTTKMNQLASKLLHCFVMSFSNRGPRVNYANKLQ